MLAQSPKVPEVLVPGLAARFRIDNQHNCQSQGAHLSVGAKSHIVTVENKAEHQNVTSNVESEAVVGCTTKLLMSRLENEGQH
ncbi:hypothetical protein SOVF_110320 [Spinacia oleracea]|nr:hypothetical protein SOVF_110320 [Spinacia oleracea]